MKYVLTILSLLIINTAISQPIANAGADQTIYLTSTNSVTLNGTSSTGTGLSYQWREVSTDYSSGATITNANTATATVSPLPQGVFYFELQVTDNVDRVSVDTVVINVRYSIPVNSTLLHAFNFSDPNALKTINNRTDTVSYFPVSNTTYSQFTDATSTDWFLFRDRTNGLMIDSLRGKLTSMIEDKYQGTDGYARAEIQPADYDMTFDTNHIYAIQWQGYFPQSQDYLTSWYSMLNMVQLHSKTQTATVFQMNQLSGDYEGVVDVYYQGGTDDPYGYGPGFTRAATQVSTVSDFYNKAHTVLIRFKEGKLYTGQDAFIELFIDGVLKYYRNTGQVGSSTFDDYPKFGGLYDPNRAVVNIDSASRGRQYKLVTTSYNIYTVSDTTVNAAPTISMSGDQLINTTSTNVTAVGTPASGESITSYSWTKLSGTGTITSPSSSTTGLTGLSGTSTYQCTVTQTDGQTASGTVTVTVNSAPTANAGTDQTITLPTNTVTLSGSGTDTDGTISSYSWTKISGGSATITSPTSASTTITGLVAGTYIFQLQVTDNNGATATDTVQITVKSLSNYFITHGNKIYINK
jgi:hypothetical protein